MAVSGPSKPGIYHHMNDRFQEKQALKFLSLIEPICGRFISEGRVHKLIAITLIQYMTGPSSSFCNNHRIIYVSALDWRHRCAC